MNTPTHFMNQTATVYSESWALDINGSPTGSYLGPTPAPTVQCSIQPRSATEGLQYGRPAASKLAVGYFPPSTVLAVTDRIVVGTDTYFIVGLPRNVAEQGSYLKCDLETRV